jgi:hypothetical protein
MSFSINQTIAFQFCWLLYLDFRDISSGLVHCSSLCPSSRTIYRRFSCQESWCYLMCLWVQFGNSFGLNHSYHTQGMVLHKEPYRWTCFECPQIGAYTHHIHTHRSACCCCSLCQSLRLFCASLFIFSPHVLDLLIGLPVMSRL